MIELEMIKINKLLEDIYKSNNVENKMYASQRISVMDLPLEDIIESNNLLESEIDEENLEEKVIKKSKKGKFTRSRNQSYTGEKISVTKIKSNYIIGHLTNADLSILSDFKEFKDKLDIVQNNLITLKTPILVEGINVYVRDTMLLAPGGMKGLSAIGNLYGSHLSKIDIDKKWLEKMDEFWEKDPEAFKRYAIRDSLIALIHASYMEDVSIKLGKAEIPLTLASLGLTYVRNSWAKNDYQGYQLSPDYLLSEPNSLQTPKGLFNVGDIGFAMSMYIGNYKGGRNECFMYGKDDNLYVSDYDLVSAYTTAMTLLGDPDYSRLAK
jgi:hypothetical protein